MSELPPGAQGYGGPPAPGWWLASDGRYYPPQSYQPQIPPYGYVPQSTNGLAIAALVLGILWLYWLGSILALVFGYVALSQIKRSGGAQSGRGMAIAGVVLGWIGLAVAALVLVIGIVVAATVDDVDSDPSDGYCDFDRFVEDPDC